MATASMTVLALRETGHVAGVLTRATGTDGSGDVAALVGAGLPVTVDDRTVDVPAAALTAVTLPFDATVVEDPATALVVLPDDPGGTATLDQVVAGHGKLKSVKRSTLVVGLDPATPVSADTAYVVVLQVSDGATTSVRGTIPESASESKAVPHGLAPGAEVRALVLVAGYARHVQDESIP